MVLLPDSTTQQTPGTAGSTSQPHQNITDRPLTAFDATKTAGDLLPPVLASMSAQKNSALAKHEKLLALARRCDDQASALTAAQQAAAQPLSPAQGKEKKTYSPTLITTLQTDSRQEALLRSDFISCYKEPGLRERVATEFDYHRQHALLAMMRRQLSDEWQQRDARLMADLDFYAGKIIQADGEAFDKLLQAVHARADAMDLWFRPGQKKQRLDRFLHSVQYARAKRHIEEQEGQDFDPAHYPGLLPGSCTELEDFAHTTAIQARTSRYYQQIRIAHTTAEGSPDWQAIRQAVTQTFPDTSSPEYTRIQHVLTCARQEHRQEQKNRKEARRNKLFTEILNAMQKGQLLTALDALELLQQTNDISTTQKTAWTAALKKEHIQTDPLFVYQAVCAVFEKKKTATAVLADAGGKVAPEDITRLMTALPAISTAWRFLTVHTLHRLASELTLEKTATPQEKNAKTQSLLLFLEYTATHCAQNDSPLHHLLQGTRHDILATLTELSAG